jgi:hypothetical protein
MRPARSWHRRPYRAGVFGLRKGEKPGALFYRDDIARKGAALPKAKAAAITSLLVYSLMQIFSE